MHISAMLAIALTAVTPTLKDSISASRVVSAPSFANYGFTLSYAPFNALGGSPSSSVLRDTNVLGSIGLTQNCVAISTTPVGTAVDGALTGVTFTPSDVTVATADTLGNITPVGSNPVTARVLVQTPRGMAQTILVPLSESTSISQAYSSYVTGSGAAAILADITGRITNSSVASLSQNYFYRRMFSTQNYSAGSYAWNTAAWCGSVNFTCMSPWNNSGEANEEAGTAISPRHVVCAHHFAWPNGTQLQFVGSDNVTYTRTILGVSQVGTSDFSIGILNSDLPPAVTPAMLPPANFWTSYCPGGPTWLQVPVICTSQDQYAYVGSMGPISGPTITFLQPLDTTQLLWSYKVRTGDSGHPVFTVFSGNTVLLSVWSGGSEGSFNGRLTLGFGYDTSQFVSAFNTVMSALSTSVSAGSNYQVTTVPTTGFSTY